MSLPAQIIHEARHRWLNSSLALLGVVATVALPVFFLTAGEAARRETSRLMRDIGYNLRIIPRAANPQLFWREGYAQQTMPEDVARRFADQRDVSYNHLLAMLQRRIEWQGHGVLLTGISTEVIPPGKAKAPMIFRVEPGTLIAGWEIARTLDLKPGTTVNLRGHSFQVRQCLVERGNRDDIRVWVSLTDAQKLLDAPGRINEIQALECLCRDGSQDQLGRLRRELTRIIPEGRVLRDRSRAEARQRQRRMTERYLAALMPVLLILCAAWLAFLAILNVRDRRSEIGILRALGHHSGRIAVLFLGKAAALGLLGALLGFGLGTALAFQLGETVFSLTFARMRTLWSLLGYALLLAPLFAAVASLLPTAIAVTQDPAITLRGDE